MLVDRIDGDKVWLGVKKEPFAHWYAYDMCMGLHCIFQHVCCADEVGGRSD